MGFLSRFIKGEIQNQVRGMVKNAADNVIKNIQNNNADNVPVASQPAAVKVRPNVSHKEPFEKDFNAIGSSVSNTGSTAYFSDLIEKNIQGVMIVNDAELGVLTDAIPKKNKPIDILVYRDDAPVIAIMIVPKNKYNNISVINTMNICEANGVPAIRFMKEFRNEPPYVVGRIKAIMK